MRIEGGGHLIFCIDYQCKSRDLSGTSSGKRVCQKYRTESYAPEVLIDG